MLYEPKGRAGEYGRLAVNLYTNCPHGCLYCYVPQTLRRDKTEFHSGPVRPKPNWENILRKDLEKQAKFAARHAVFMCFACDPYPNGYEALETRAAIEMIHSFGFPVRLLTKSAEQSYRDFDLLTDQDTFGVSLSTLTQDAAVWEPGASAAMARYFLLQAAKKRGLRTWVSLEPVLGYAEAVGVLEAVKGYADTVYIGKLNYMEYAKTIDWPAVAVGLWELATKLGINAKFKKDLAIYLQEGE